jgi:hypothetical protein
MERGFSMEAKKFFFSVQEAKVEFHLEERRKDFVGYFFVMSNAPFGWWIRLKR